MKSRFYLATLALAFVAPAFAQTTQEPPVAVRTVTPEYPEDLKRDGVMGLVVITCTIDIQGNVVEPVVEKSSNAAFDKPAVEALQKWKFKPARTNGTPIARKVSIPIKFVAES